MSSTKRWPQGAIVYQVYPRSFFDTNGDGVGDIPGVTAKLPYLKDLGVNAIWISPFYPSPMADFGYDVADYCGVDPMFGTLEDMKELLKAAHAKDLKIIVDLVPNHSSDEHEWFKKSRQSREGKYSDWYIWHDAKGLDDSGEPIPPNNWLDIFSGESAWEWVPEREQYYLHSFHVKQPDLNWANPEVREAIKDVMRFWLDMGVDGFRVDAVWFMAKDPLFNDNPVNPDYKPGKDAKYAAQKQVNNQGWPPLFAYLAEMAAVLKEEPYSQPLRFMVTEAYPQTHEHVPEYLEFYKAMDPEVAAPFNFEGLELYWRASSWKKFLGVFHEALDGMSPLCVASYAFGNHDQHRLATRLGDKAARSAAVMLLTLPGMSFIYNGEEIGMHNREIPPELVQDPGAKDQGGRDPERTPLHWTPGKNAGFTTGETTWLPIGRNYKERNIETEAGDPDSFLSLYRQLGKLRNTSSSLKEGEFKLIETGNPDVVGYIRGKSKTGYAVVINFSDEAQTIETDISLGKFVLSSSPETELNTAKGDKKHMRPNEAAIFKL